MTSTDNSFLISIERCNKDISNRLTYAIHKAAWKSKLKYAKLGTNVAITNDSFHLYAVVKLSATSNPARVSTLLYLPESATVVPTNVDFSTYHISNNFIHLLEYGTLDDSTINSDSVSTLTNDYVNHSDGSFSDHQIEGQIEPPNIEVIGGPDNNQGTNEYQMENPVDEMVEEADILSVSTYYNEANEMTLFNSMLRNATAEEVESYRRTKRILDRTSGQIDTLVEDSFCFVCRLKIVAKDHSVKLGIHCVHPKCNRAQLYHYPCLLNYIFNTRGLPRCDYCRPREGR